MNLAIIQAEGTGIQLGAGQIRYHKAVDKGASMTESDVKRMQALLADELATLTETLEASLESAKGTALDQARIGRLSRMDALQSQAMAQGANRRLAEDITAIRAALERIERGTYGICAGCDREIDLMRLEVYPATERCLPCAKRRE